MTNGFAVRTGGECRGLQNRTQLTWANDDGVRHRAP